MKKIVVLVAFIAAIFEVASQEIEENRNFVLKTNGEVVYGKTIDYKTPVFKKKYLQIEDLKISSKEVKFYQSDRGFFGSFKGERFAQRILKGKVNYYESSSIYYHAPMPALGGFGMTTGGVGGAAITNYYNKGWEPLKLVKYENLIVDLKDNLQSVEYLEKFRTAKKKRTLAYVLGGIAMVAGILTASKETGETKRSFNPDSGRIEDVAVTELRPVNLAIGLAGFGTIIGTYFSSREKRDYMRKAIEVYNE